jgi:hydroxypyruvate reductase
VPPDPIQTILDAALAAGDPRAAVAGAWPTDLSGPVHLLATGKASLEMTDAAIVRLGPDFTAGLVTAVPERVVAAVGGLDPSRVRILPADHPLPTPRNVAAAEEVLRFVAKVPTNATLLLLISGGGSAHLTLPADGLILDDLRTITSALQRAGATIEDLNAVRKHAERLKGGRLAAATPARRVLALVMSDVEDDRLDVISSGPAAPDPTTYADALRVLDRHALTDLVPTLTAHLRAGAEGRRPETIKPGDPSLARVTHRVIASNRRVLDAAADKARAMGLFVQRDHRFIAGGAAAEGRRLGATLRRLSTEGRPTCFLAGGEPVVSVGTATGAGGPSQELALAAAVELDGARGVTLAAFSTDGVDGPPSPDNPHAGAIVTGETARRARSLGLDPIDHLARHDAAPFFSRLQDALRTGPTGTNLNHVVVGILDPSAR